MKNKNGLFNLYKSMTGKTTTTPKAETTNPTGYQVPRVDSINRYGYGGN